MNSQQTPATTPTPEGPAPGNGMSGLSLPVLNPTLDAPASTHEASGERDPGDSDSLTAPRGVAGSEDTRTTTGEQLPPTGSVGKQ